MLQSKNEKMQSKVQQSAQKSVRKSIAQRNKENTIAMAHTYAPHQQPQTQFCPQQCIPPTPQKLSFWVDANNTN